MNFIMFVLAFVGPSQSGGEGGGALGFFFPIILIFAIMYFLIFRPQAKRQKQHREMQKSLQKGDRILTVGGIYGTILNVKEKENTIVVKIADGVKVEMTPSSVANKLSDQPAKN